MNAGSSSLEMILPFSLILGGAFLLLSIKIVLKCCKERKKQVTQSQDYDSQSEYGSESEYL